MRAALYDGELYVTYHSESGILRWFTTNARIGFKEVGKITDQQAIAEAESLAVSMNMDLYLSVEED